MEIDEKLDENLENNPWSKDNSDVSKEKETLEKDNSHDDNDSETYKKRYSDSSREAKKLAQTHSAYRKVLQDNSYLLELDTDLAKDVVKQLHEDWYSQTDSYDELVRILKWEKTTDNNKSESIDKDKLVKDIRAQILAEQQEEKSNDILEKSLSKFDDEVKEKYLEEFRETVGKRKLTPDFTKKEIDKIIIYHNRKKSKQEKDDEALWSLASNWLGWTKSTTKTIYDYR